MQISYKYPTIGLAVVTSWRGRGGWGGGGGGGGGDSLNATMFPETALAANGPDELSANARVCLTLLWKLVFVMRSSTSSAYSAVCRRRRDVVWLLHAQKLAKGVVEIALGLERHGRRHRFSSATASGLMIALFSLSPFSPLKNFPKAQTH